MRKGCIFEKYCGLKVHGFDFIKWQHGWRLIPGTGKYLACHDMIMVSLQTCFILLSFFFHFLP